MKNEHWNIQHIKLRAKELLEEYPKKKLISLDMMIQNVIAARREMNWIRTSRFR